MIGLYGQLPRDAAMGSTECPSKWIAGLFDMILVLLICFWYFLPMMGPLKTNALAQWIVDSFRAGVTLTPEHLQYMQATFGTTDPAVILDEHDGSEIDSYLQLVYYPDQALRMRYENDWGETLFSTADIEAVMVQLKRAPLWGKINRGSGHGQLPVELSIDLLQAWMERLKILWQPAPAIALELNQFDDKRQQVVIRTHLRHAPLEWHSGQTALVARLLAKMRLQPEGSIGYLSDLLSLLIQMGAGQAEDSFFSDRKAFYFELLCKAEAFEARRCHEAMEVLMLQGCRAAFGTADHWRQEMARIDRLSRLLFGNIPDIGLMDCRTQALPQKPIYKPYRLP